MWSVGYCGCWWSQAALSFLFKADGISHAAFPIAPEGTSPWRHDLGASGSFGGNGSLVWCLFRTLVLCLNYFFKNTKNKGKKPKKNPFFSMILKCLVIEILGLWLKIYGWPDGTYRGICGDLRSTHVDQSQKWHRGRSSARGVHQPPGQKVHVCVHADSLRAASSHPELSPILCPVLPRSCVILTEINLAWGDGEYEKALKIERELGKGKLPFQPSSRTIPVSNVLLSQSSPTPHQCCPSWATSWQCFTSATLPAPHGF